MNKLVLRFTHSKLFPLVFGIVMIATVYAIGFYPLTPGKAVATPTVAAPTVTIPVARTAIVAAPTEEPTVVTDPAVLDGHLVTLTDVGEDSLIVEMEGLEYEIPYTFLFTYERTESEFEGLRTLKPVHLGRGSVSFIGQIHLETGDAVTAFWVWIVPFLGDRSFEERQLESAARSSYWSESAAPASVNFDFVQELVNPDQPWRYNGAAACRIFRQYQWAAGRYGIGGCRWNIRDPYQSWAEFRGVYGAEQFRAPDGSSIIVMFNLPPEASPLGYLWCAAETPTPMRHIYLDRVRPLDLRPWYSALWMGLARLDGEGTIDYPLPEGGWVAFGPIVADDDAEFDIRSYKIFTIGNRRHELDCTNN